MILLTTEFADATPLSRKAVELTGLPGAMDACGKPAQEDRFAPPGGFPTCVHNPLENAEAFSSAPWKTGSRETPKTVGLPRQVSHNPTASTTMRKNSTTTRKKGLTLHRGTKKHKKENEKKLTYFFIKKYDQPLCLNCVSLRAFLCLFVAIS